MIVKRATILERSLLLGLLLLWWGAPAMAENDIFPAVDTNLPTYSPQIPVSGKVEITGSNTMKPILEKWKNKLEKVHPGLEILLEMGGSNIGIDALINGKTEIAAMSRPLTDKEIKEFSKQIGYPPMSVPVAVDAFAVFVHKDNPLDHITFQQLDAVFSSERRRGVPQSLDSWGQLGLSGDWAQAPILAQVRDSQSGTGQFFREFVLQGGKEKESVTTQPGAASVVYAIMNEPYAIGYSGIGYRTNLVKPLHVAAGEGEAFVEPTFDSAMNGSYPLRRLLYLYVNLPPNTEPSPLLSEIIRFGVSQEGQQLVARSGFFPLPTKDLLALSNVWSRPVTSVATQKSSR